MSRPWVLAILLAATLASASCGGTDENPRHDRDKYGDTNQGDSLGGDTAHGGDQTGGDQTGGDQAGGDQSGGDQDTSPNTCSPLAGTLVITEVMMNPAGTDTGAEWIEIYNPTSQPQALAGLTIEHTQTGSDIHTVSLANQTLILANGYLVLGSGNESHVDYSYGGDIPDLGNEGGALMLRCDETIVDHVAWGGTDQPMAPLEGSAMSLNGNITPHYVLNDDPARWCPATSAFDGTNLGTPGAANPVCSVTYCHDGFTMRPVASPAAGELVITEVYANPPGSDGDGAAEWLEIFNITGAALDINGLSVVNTNATNERVFGVTPLDGAGACVSIPAAAYALLAGDTDTDINGHLPGVTALLIGNALYNSTAPLAVSLRVGALVVDSAPYPTPNDGVASSLGGDTLDSSANDNLVNWCDAVVWGMFNGLGTPGIANPRCGVLFCQDGGSLRVAISPQPGDLVISEIYADPPGADRDGASEWIELLVSADTDIDIFGLQVVSRTATGSRGFTLAGDDCARVTPGQHVLLAGAADGQPNGGLPFVTVVLRGADPLYNGNDGTSLIIELAGSELDSAPYRATTEGVSYSLDPDFGSPSGNDDPLNWCAGQANGQFNGTGTPGSYNDQCP